MRTPSLLRFAGHRPLRPTPWLRLGLAAVASLALWQGVEAATGRLTHPAYPQMLRAAHTMQAATQVARSQRAALGLMAPRAFDPNQTGLLGAEYTDTTTTLGDPAAKRTATNPDLAAALVRRIAGLDLPEGSPVLIVLSGSFIGADIAAIVAVEELGLRPVLVSSLGASMHGATDAELTWLDIEAELRAKGVIRARSLVALLGGGASIGGGMSDEGVATLQAAADRHGVPLLQDADLDRLLERLLALAEAEAGAPPRLLVNAGGSVAALGTCIDVALIAPLTQGRGLSCQDGLPGLLVRLTGQGVPAISLLNMREVAAEWGLPFDPVPMPVVGNNRAVYGMPPAPRAGEG
ncbi:MAG: poly-gamma-glutamate system protein [Acetobacteraceae bacterium]|nr:poly-gamma-glutamate system protein [Acetobacteraceae bacterium]